MALKASKILKDVPMCRGSSKATQEALNSVEAPKKTILNGLQDPSYII